MAFLELLAAATGAGIVTSHLAQRVAGRIGSGLVLVRTVVVIVLAAWAVNVSGMLRIVHRGLLEFRSGCLTGDRQQFLEMRIDLGNELRLKAG